VAIKIKSKEKIDTNSAPTPTEDTEIVDETKQAGIEESEESEKEEDSEDTGISSKEYIRSLCSKISPVKAIRKFCLECVGGNRNYVRECECAHCPLWPFRMGKNPFIERDLTDEQKEASLLRLKKAREATDNV